MRIDNIINSNQKKSQESITSHRRAFEAEEKLKKLAEQADLAKKMLNLLSKENAVPKSSQEKTEAYKKFVVTHSIVTRKKIQSALQKVTEVQRKSLPNKKRKLLIVGKKLPGKSTKALSKVVSTKVGFQRHFKKNQSQRKITPNLVGKNTKNTTAARNISKTKLGNSNNTKKEEVEVRLTNRRRSEKSTGKFSNYISILKDLPGFFLV